MTTTKTYPSDLDNSIRAVDFKSARIFKNRNTTCTSIPIGGEYCTTNRVRYGGGVTYLCIQPLRHSNDLISELALILRSIGGFIRIQSPAAGTRAFNG